MSQAVPLPRDLLDLTGKVAIVTGSGSGLGRGIALRFGQAGAKVVVHYRANQSGAEAIATQIRESGAEAVALGGDLTQKAAAERLIAETVGTFGRVDVLINNAGIYPVAPLLEMGETDWDDMINANLRSVFLCTQAAAKQMIAQGQGGSIINIASIEASRTAALHSHYNAAKAGVVMHTKAAAFELGSHQIRVNAVSPGLIWTQGIEQSWPDGVKRWMAKVPLGRMGLPDDVADACLFLASPAARWISGIDLVVDGGVLATPAF